MKKWLQWSGLLLLIVLLMMATAAMSCSAPKRAQWHLRKAWALDPHLGDSAVIVVTDTLIVPGDTIDRVVVTKQQDTVVFTKDRVVTRIIRDFDTLRVFTECPADTIIHTVKVPCPPQVTLQKRLTWSQRSGWILAGVALAVVGFGLARYYPRR